jgi:hypothetical protein
MMASIFYHPLFNRSPASSITHTMLCFFSIYNMFLCVMYGSVIISMLTIQAEDRGVDVLEDLLRNQVAR